MQFTDEDKKKLHKNLTERILAAEDAIKNTTSSDQPEETKQKTITYLNDRRNQLTLSVLVVYNTNRIAEMRIERLKDLKHFIEATPNLGPNELLIKEREIKELKKAGSCKKCYKRGWIGFKQLTGEFAFCSCTLDTLHHYIH